MSGLGASKLCLSSLSSEGLWRRSGRLADESELLKVRTRAKDAFLLSPTHEEEITKLVASAISSPKDLPLRLYQVTRKYRDERRPRQGLLRTREFVMKDLYTFDMTEQTAFETYNTVKQAYTALFESFHVPYLIAEADTGNMGGSRSHEFHFPSPLGEDTLFHCNACSYIANEELATAFRPANLGRVDGTLRRWMGIQKDGRTLVVVYFRSSTSDRSEDDEINLHNLKRVVPALDTSVEQPLQRWLTNMRARLTAPPEMQASEEDLPPFTVFPLYDAHSIVEAPAVTPVLPFQEALNRIEEQAQALGHDGFEIAKVDPPLNCGTDLIRVRKGDTCPACQVGKLKTTQAIELGHTFQLGTRYSEPLQAVVNPPGGLNEAGAAVAMPVFMGCHGIGISRIMGALAAILRDDAGLNWPQLCAPFEVVIVPGSKTTTDDVSRVYDKLSGAQPQQAFSRATSIDAVIDDREGSLVQKLKDADLIGFPVIVALGRAWEEGQVELQCRQKAYKSVVNFEDLTDTVYRLLYERANANGLDPPRE
ncbi:MAG: hypothetical protein Q9162_002652 [Coniocarpon cinnabarinum]